MKHEHKRQIIAENQTETKSWVLAGVPIQSRERRALVYVRPHRMHTIE